MKTTTCLLEENSPFWLKKFGIRWCLENNQFLVFSLHFSLSHCSSKEEERKGRKKRRKVRFEAFKTI